MSIREYISSAVKIDKQESAIKSVKYTYDEEENNDDVDAGDIDSIKFWGLPSYGNDWRDNLLIAYCNLRMFMNPFWEKDTTM